MPEPDFSRPRQKASPRPSQASTTGRRGFEHEKRIEKRTGDRRVKGSGSKPGRPGDLRGVVFLREAKTTKGKGRMVKGEEIAKLSEQALRLGKIPVLEICFEGQVPPAPRDWVMLPADDFDWLLGGE